VQQLFPTKTYPHGIPLSNYHNFSFAESGNPLYRWDCIELQVTSGQVEIHYNVGTALSCK